MLDQFRRLFAPRPMMLLLVFQLVACSVLIGWWRHVALSQADQISTLQATLGIEDPVRVKLHDKVHRMINWESAWFLLVIFASAGSLSWLYARDLKRSNSLRSFFASLAHELRTPLTSIRLQAESIAECPENDAEYRARLVDRLLQDTTRLEGEVHRALELARIEGGGDVQRTVLNLKPTIEKIVNEWLATHRDKATVHRTIADVTVIGDPRALKTIVTNLLENSIIHGQKENLSIRIAAEKTGNLVLIQYHDDGVGLGNTVRRNLGRLFFKGHNSSGSGVGLYLVKTLTEKMGGRVAFGLSSGFSLTMELQAGGDFLG